MALSFCLSLLLMVLSVLALQGDSSGVCPKNWIHLQRSCYKFSSKTATWIAAKSACESQGSKLAVVKSQAENKALTSRLKTAAYIGLYRDPKDPSSWLWTDGSRATYTNWDKGQPNNKQPKYEDCVAIHKSGYWHDWPCKTAKNYYVCETIEKCPALNLSRHLKVSPNSCVTSPMKINAKCSFSCPPGYQLQGPLYKQCRSRGQWTNNDKPVSCIDIDECSVSSNGGCSHKCLNFMGGYKCDCPDEELSLSSDNRTCHASGVNVLCNSKNMTIIIPKSSLRGLDRGHLRLLDTTCKATQTGAYFSLSTQLTGCNTTKRHTPSGIVYSNALLEISVAAEDVITRVREIEIQFSCFYSKYGVVSTVGWKPSNRKLVFSEEGQGNYTLSLDMFPDNRFVSPYMQGDFPVAVMLRRRLFFEVSVASDDKQLSIRAARCFATPTQAQKNRLKYEFIKNGCPDDQTLKYHAAPSVSTQRFSLEAFKFIADHPFVFVHCHVIICNASNPGSKCAKSCSFGGRGRREVSEHVTGMYFLAQGPLHLAREKRAEKRGSGLEKSESAPTLMVAFFGMCLACLAGTVLMIFKKSRVKPDGYAVLATDDQKGKQAQTASSNWTGQSC